MPNWLQPSTVLIGIAHAVMVIALVWAAVLMWKHRRQRPPGRQLIWAVVVLIVLFAFYELFK